MKQKGKELKMSKTLVLQYLKTKEPKRRDSIFEYHFVNKIYIYLYKFGQNIYIILITLLRS